MTGAGVSGLPLPQFSLVLTTPPAQASYALLAAPALCQSHTGGSQLRVYSGTGPGLLQPAVEKKVCFQPYMIHMVIKCVYVSIDHTRA